MYLRGDWLSEYLLAKRDSLRLRVQGQYAVEPIIAYELMYAGGVDSVAGIWRRRFSLIRELSDRWSCNIASSAMPSAGSTGLRCSPLLRRTAARRERSPGSRRVPSPERGVGARLLSQQRLNRPSL